MIKSFHIWYILFCLLLPCFPISGQGLLFEWTKLPEKDLEPGSSGSMVLEISNQSEDSALSFRSTFILPPGWFGMSMGNEQLFTLEPGDTTHFIFTFRIPDNYETTLTTLRVKYRNDRDSLLKSFPIEIHIRKKFDLRVQKNNPREYAVAGTDLRSKYQLFNSGNTPLTLKIRSRNCLLADQKDSLFILPGEIKDLDIIISPGDHIMQNERFRYKLSFIPEEFDTVFHFYDDTEVLPNTSIKPDMYERIPSRISLNYLLRQSGDNYEGSFQGSIYGQHTLNDSAGNYIEYGLRGPDRMAYSTFGNYEEYYFKYQHPNYGIYVGDQVFQLSRLTEFGRYSRGISLNYKWKNLSTSVFSGAPRFFPGLKHESGIKTSYNFGNFLNIGTTLLHKKYDTPDSAALIPSLFFDLNIPHLHLESEVAQSFDGNQQHRAYRSSLESYIRKFRLSAGVLYAEPLFGGFFRNSGIANASFGYTMKKLSFSLNTNYTNSNPSLDTLFLSAPLSYNFMGILIYQITKQSDLRINAGRRRRKDRLSLRLFDYAENFIRLNFKQRTGNFNYRLFSEFGTTENYQLADDYQPFSYNFGGSVHYKFLQKLEMAANISYLDNQRYGRERYRNMLYGGNIYWNIDPSTNTSISYQNNYNIEDYYMTQDFFEFTFLKRPAKHHEISLSARYSKPRNRSENLLFVSTRYTYHFGLPYRQKKGRSVIKGRVTNTDGTPAEGVILRLNGRKALTDKNGEFIFNRLKKGSYLLLIDPGSIDIDITTSANVPFVIELQEGDVSHIPIILIATGNLSGKIRFPAGHASVLEKNVQDVHTVYIEITNGELRYMQTCDPEGNFRFPHLKPGSWEVKLVNAGLNNLEFDRISASVNISSNETTEVNFTARRKTKKLKITGAPVKISSR